MTRRRRNLMNGMAAVMGIAAALLATACSDSTGPADAATVARVDVVAPSAALTVGHTMKLRAEPRDRQGAVLSNRAIVWTTSDSTVAAVDQTGTVTARGAGTATVSATVEGKAGRATVTVRTNPQPGPEVLELVIAGTPVRTVDGNRMEQLFANLIAPGGLVVAIFPHSPAGRSISWASSNPSVVQISETGEITTGWAGTSTITAESAGQRAELVVQVRTAVRSVIVRGTPQGMLAIGATAQLTADVNPETFAPSARPITWSSSNERVATVDANGKVTAHKSGLAIIYANVEGVLGRASIEVAGKVEQPLEAAGGQTLPALLLTKLLTEDGGTRVQRVFATGGSFTMTKDAQYGFPESYVLRLTLRVEEDGRIPREVQYADEGRATMTWLGEFLFESSVHAGLKFKLEELYEAAYWRTGEIEVDYAMPGYESVKLRFGKP